MSSNNKYSQYLVIFSLIIMILSILTYLNFNNPKELQPPNKKRTFIKKINVPGKIVNKTDQYSIEFLTLKPLNLSQFNISEKEEINNVDYLITKLKLKTKNISEIIDYLKKHQAKINEIKRKVLIEIDFLNQTRKDYIYLPLRKANNTINMTCVVEYENNVPILIKGCIPKY